MSSWSDRLKVLVGTAELIKLPMEGPPCAHCKNWYPHVTLTSSGQPYRARCCIAPRLHDDFTCYEDKKASPT